MTTMILTVLSHPTNLTPQDWGLTDVPAAACAAAALGQAAADAMAAADGEAAWDLALDAMGRWMDFGSFGDQVFDVMRRYIDAVFCKNDTDNEYAVLPA